jgi:uncharacterized protein (TIGR02145 family)
MNKKNISIFLFIIYFIISCEPLERLIAIKFHKYENGVATGEIVDFNSGITSEFGFCYSKNPNPTVMDSVFKLGRTKRGIFKGDLNLDQGQWFINAYVSKDNDFIYSNEVEVNLDAPVIWPLPVEFVFFSAAILKGQINPNGTVQNITFEYGITDFSNSYNASPNKVSGNETLNLIANINDLEPGTIYKYRLKSIGKADTTISEELSFETINYGESVSDIDGNIYKTVQIGTQFWMCENLKTTKFNNGVEIALIEDKEMWANHSMPGYCIYDNDELKHKSTLGVLYNWYCLEPEKLCPPGWHAATDKDWNQLSNYLGGDDISGGKLTEKGFLHWDYYNTGATDECGFSARGSGYRDFDGSFRHLRVLFYTWSYNKYIQDKNLIRYINEGGIALANYEVDKVVGCSVRCVKD